MSTPTPRAGFGLLQVCLAGILWGTGGLGVQVIRERVPMSVLTISAWRMLIAAVVLLVVLVAFRQLPTLVALARAHPARVALVGCGTAAYQALYFGSVVAVGVSVSTVVSLGLAPVLLTIAESVRQRTVPRRDQVGVLVLALPGSCWSASPRERTSPDPTRRSACCSRSARARRTPRRRRSVGPWRRAPRP